MDELRFNGERYSDPTVYLALRSIEREERKSEKARKKRRKKKIYPYRNHCRNKEKSL